MERIYVLLGRQAKKYLACESTSLPSKTAQELLRSLLYTLRLALSETGRPEDALLTCDLGELLTLGQDLVQKKLADARRLWEQACLASPEIPNRFHQETLIELGRFFKRYDPWYFAHQIPCSLDYPLCIPVPEELQGVSYVEVWLRRVLSEHWLLSRFPAQAVLRLLAASVPDLREYPLNLCEQPVVTAAGLALLHRPVLPLDLSDGDCVQLAAVLRGCGDWTAAWSGAADRTAAELCAPQEAAEYLRAILDCARPRLGAALSAGEVRSVFLPESP